MTCHWAMVARSTGIERITDPLHPWRIRAAIHRNHIEAARTPCKIAVVREKTLRRQNQLALLGRIDRWRAATKSSAAAIANLNEHDHIAIAHHQVDLADAVPLVRDQQAQAGSFKMSACGKFPICTGCSAIRACYA